MKIFGLLLLIMLRPTEAAFAIDYPLTSDEATAAVAFGSTAENLRAMLENNEWQVVCTNCPYSETMHLQTPFFELALKGLEAKAKFDDLASVKPYALSLNRAAKFKILTIVSSSLLAENTEPVVVVQQKNKTIKSRDAVAGDATPHSYGFSRAVSASFDLRSIDLNQDFDIIVSNIDDDGRPQMLFTVHPATIR